MSDRAVRALAVLGLVACGAVGAMGQSLPQVADPTTPRRGVFRISALSAWERYDARFAANGTLPLGAIFNTDTLGVAQIPQLDTIQSAIAAALGSPFKLDLGAAKLNATARANIVPIGIEYGITDRLSVGVVFPVVRQRVAVEFVTYPYRFDLSRCFPVDSTNPTPCHSSANVGPNPNRTSATAAAVNLQVQAEFTDAESQLAAKLAACQADNSGAGCAQVLAQGPQLLQASQSFASAVAALYGDGSTPTGGMAFVPSRSSTAQAAIAARVAGFNTQYRTLLGSGTDLLTTVPAGAGFAGSADIQNYLVNELGRDSLGNVERLGYGDVEIGARLRLLERLRDSVRGIGTLATVAASVRLPTGSLLSPSEISDMRLGSGRVIVDSRGILDVRSRRFGLLASAHAGIAVSTPDSTRAVPDKRVIDLDVAPRYHVSEPLAIHLAYSLRAYDVSGTEQLAGGGVSYLSPSVYRRGAPSVPVEMRFTHLETISGTAGRPKFFIDQIELRIYWRLFGG